VEQRESQRARRESRIIWIFFLITILMVNPPILTWLNVWFKAHPLVGGWPTLWLYLTFWYVVMLGGFLYFALKFRTWQAKPLEAATAADKEEED
jgi:hypothetical protein